MTHKLISKNTVVFLLYQKLFCFIYDSRISAATDKEFRKSNIHLSTSSGQSSFTRKQSTDFIFQQRHISFKNDKKQTINFQCLHDSTLLIMQFKSACVKHSTTDNIENVISCCAYWQLFHKTNEYSCWMLFSWFSVM